MLVFGCKGSVKFRVSEEKAYLFAFLSVRNLSNSSEKPNISRKNSSRRYDGYLTITGRGIHHWFSPRFRFLTVVIVTIRIKVT